MTRFVFAIVAFWASCVFAADTANLEKGLMLKGYDPVSYFKNAKPIKGNPAFKAEHAGLNYLFASEEHKQEFLKSPQTYVPQFEGWCATAVADGYKYDIDPENFKITDGRLFLFYKGWKGDAKKTWLKNEPEQIKKADTKWPQVKVSKE